MNTLSTAYAMSARLDELRGHVIAVQSAESQGGIMLFQDIRVAMGVDRC